MAADALPQNSTSIPATEEYSNGEDLMLEAVTLMGLSLAVAGVVASTVACSAVWAAQTRNTALRLGLLSLSAADILIALSCTGLLGFQYHWHRTRPWLNEEDWPQYRRDTCANEVFRWLFYVATDANQFSLIFLAGQQFVAIRWPLRSAEGFSARKCLAMLGAAWAISAALGLAMAAVIAGSTGGHPRVETWASKGSTRFCYQVVLYYYYSDTNSGTYGFAFGQDIHTRVLIGLDIAKVLFVLAALATSYGYVIITMGRSLRLGGSSAELAAANRLRDRKRVVVITLLVTLLCMVCYMPQFISRTLEQLGCTLCNQPVSSSALMAVVAVAPIADPLIYTLRLKAMRDGAGAAFACRRPAVGNRYRGALRHNNTVSTQ